MPTDKQIKKEFRVTASKDPDKYYSTEILKDEGFSRKQCTECQTYFWSVTESEVCGDPACSGGYRFIGDSPAKADLDYVGVWKKFSKMFKDVGYTPIPRYPVMARWRKDTDFVQASIYDFQPYVVSGEVAPPANPLVVPQFCLRFNDIDNVGITGAHYTGFTMIGQHAFMPENQWNQDKYFRDIYNWCMNGLELPKEEITFHEDAWAGGGNFGPSMEFFSRGLELGNQVYMLYEQTPTGPKELNLRVLDMGMGHERNAWFTQGKTTSYETTFPQVMKRLRHATGINTDDDLMLRFLPYASYLNVDEIDDPDEAWAHVANQIDVDISELKEKVMPMAALYSIAEHARSLTVAIADGGLPSNVGGLYNLRVIYRRAEQFIRNYEWNIPFSQVCEWHADELRPIFPELIEYAQNIHKIIDVEKTKYMATLQKSKGVVERLLQENEDVDTKKLMELYDSQGIPPDVIAEEAAKKDKYIEVPENFYALVASRHEQPEQEHATEREHKLPLDGVPDTTPLFFEDYTKMKFTATVVKIFEKHVVLDKTQFYATSGGQLHDTGTINNQEVVDVFKQGGVVVHKLKDVPTFKEGDTVDGDVNWDRRLQLAQHHTSTHIIGAAARRVLGPHINQAGAKKDTERAYIDLTHYELISKEDINRIEKEANHIVEEKINMHLTFMPRNDAEKAFGVSIYQGGVVPGKLLRIIQIPEVDVQACGGTHLNNTGEAGHISILKATKVKDGVVRLFFTAGKAARELATEQTDRVKEFSEILGVPEQQIPARAEELFHKWKLARKSAKKKRKIELSELELTSTETFEGDVVAKTSEIIGTQPEHIAKSLRRFVKEMEDYKKIISEL